MMRCNATTMEIWKVCSDARRTISPSPTIARSGNAVPRTIQATSHSVITYHRWNQCWKKW